MRHPARAGRALRAAPRHAGRRAALAPVEGWVERLDPDTLEVVGRHAAPARRHVLARRHRRPRQRRPAHGLRLLGAPAERPTSRCSPRTGCRSTRPHNSFVVLDGGELVTKDCDAPAGREPSTFSVLDPETLLPVAPAAAAARAVASRGWPPTARRVIAVGHDHGVPPAPRPRRRAADARRRWRPRYGPAPGRSYGWDPVITDEHVFWMDNGRNHVDRTMLGSGDAPRPRAAVVGAPRRRRRRPLGGDQRPAVRHRVQPARLGSRAAASSSPTTPATPSLRAWRLDGDELEPLWRRDGFAHAGHLILYPDTRELVVQDWRDAPLLRAPARAPRRCGRRCACWRARPRCGARRCRSGSDQLVVLDLDTGAEKARVAVPSPTPGASCSPPPASAATSTTSR